MTAATTPVPPTEQATIERIGGDGRVAPIVAQLARRSVILVTRLPSAFIPSVLFPIFLVVAFGGAFNGLSQLRDFPTDNILSWYVGLAIVQGSAFVGVGAGFAATREIESGFYDRLLLAPAPRRVLLLGPAVASLLRVQIPFWLVLAAGALGGAEMPGGPLALVTLFLAAAGTCLLHTFWTLGLAFRLKSQRAAPLMQIGVFLTIFLAAAQVPLDVMTGWLHEVARFNPMTNVLRLGRVGFLGDVTWDHSWGGLLALALAIPLTYVWAARGLRRMVP
jgi:ABC-2 type transport system permease protein